MTEIERKTRVARSRPTRWSPSMGVLYSHDELNRAADEYLARVAQARERKQAAVKSTAALHVGLERAEKQAIAQHVKAINQRMDAKVLALLREFGMADPN